MKQKCYCTESLSCEEKNCFCYKGKFFMISDIKQVWCRKHKPNEGNFVEDLFLATVQEVLNEELKKSNSKRTKRSNRRS